MFGFLFQIVRFRQFENMNKTGAKLEDLKIKDGWRSRKILKGDKEPMEKNIKPKPEITKTGMSSFGNRSV
jgi:hypothetical protein